MRRKALLVLSILLSIAAQSFAQNIIINNGQYFYYLSSPSGYCTFSNLSNIPCFGNNPSDGAFSSALYGDTLYFNGLDYNLYEVVLNSSAPCKKIDTGVNSRALAADETGDLYWLDTTNALIKYDPHNKTKMNLGILNYSIDGDFVFLQSKLFMTGGNGKLIEVNLSNPSQSVVVIDKLGYILYGLANAADVCHRDHIIGFSGPTAGHENGNSVVVDIDLDNKTVTPLCDLPFPVGDAASINEYSGAVTTDTLVSNIDTSGCIGMPLILNPEVSSSSAVFQWYDGSTQSTHVVNSIGKYWVSIIDSGCLRIDTFNYVSAVMVPQIYLPKDTSVCSPGPATLSPFVTSQQTILNTYSWQDGSSGNFFKVNQPGLYILKASNFCGDVVDSVNVGFENCSCTFYIPSAFTPNNDGLNDLFTPRYKCTLAATINDYHFKILNRWGQTVFASTTLNAGWNGIINGHEQPSGTYIWELQYQDIASQKIIYQHGTLILLK